MREAKDSMDLRLAWDRFLLLQVRVLFMFFLLLQVRGLFMGAQLPKCPIACAADGRAMRYEFEAIGHRRGVIWRLHLPQNRASLLCIRV